MWWLLDFGTINSRLNYPSLTSLKSDPNCFVKEKFWAWTHLIFQWTKISMYHDLKRKGTNYDIIVAWSIFINFPDDVGNIPPQAHVFTRGIRFVSQGDPEHKLNLFILYFEASPEKNEGPFEQKTPCYLGCNYFLMILPSWKFVFLHFSSASVFLVFAFWMIQVGLSTHHAIIRAASENLELNWAAFPVKSSHFHILKPSSSSNNYHISFGSIHHLHIQRHFVTRCPQQRHIHILHCDTQNITRRCWRLRQVQPYGIWHVLHIQ